MSGVISFSLSLLVMLLFAAATRWKSRRLMNLTFALMVISSLIGWYQYIFPEGLQPLFFVGTLALVLAISCFFYVVYTFDPVILREEEARLPFAHTERVPHRIMK
ncbi:hypothetical protein [Undibacterium griseum]|uniref:Uncharacterized protein n=1 Tax=Undibacterium griseum TaxID=2762295 RepID=A0ABR6YI55_9BURK|nr:hypothetical protein [Undibacterium griseum]MBC3883582.1 hypothetical protein [Undibacterium griseum]